MKILFAAFSPLSDSVDSSASLEFTSAAKSLSDGVNSVCSLELPSEWDKAFPVLAAALEDHWNAVILIGSREDIDSIAIERIALNECDPSVKDANGRRALSKCIVEAGDPGYWSGLPFRTLVNKISEAGVPCYASHSAGGGLPNYVFYKMMDWISASKSTLVGGLIQVPESDNRLALTAENAKHALHIALDVLSNIESETNEDRLTFDPKKVKMFKGSLTP